MIAGKLKKKDTDSVFPGLTLNLYVPDYEINFRLKLKQTLKNRLKKLLILTQVY